MKHGNLNAEIEYLRRGLGLPFTSQELDRQARLDAAAANPRIRPVPEGYTLHALALPLPMDPRRDDEKL